MNYEADQSWCPDALPSTTQRSGTLACFARQRRPFGLGAARVLALAAVAGQPEAALRLAFLLAAAVERELDIR